MGSLNYNFTVSSKVANAGFTYKDYKLPFEKKANSYDMAEIYDLDAIRRSLHNIFSWKRGERILLPEFGSNVYALLYEPMNETTARNIGINIKNTIERWEPRVEIVEVNVNPNYDSNEYYVVVQFSVKTIGVTSTFNIQLSA